MRIRTVLAVVLLIALPAPLTRATVLVQPISATTNMGAFPGSSASNTINQSGLSAGYLSAVTEFNSYIASNPTHDSVTNSNIWVSSSGSTVGNFDFALGTTYTIGSFVLWNQGGNENNNIVGFTLLAANNSAFTGATTLGSFTANPNTGQQSAVLPQVFTFTPRQASFVRMQITSNNGSASFTVFGEAAFHDVVIPEPSSFALVGLCVFGAGLAAYRKRRTGNTV